MPNSESNKYQKELRIYIKDDKIITLHRICLHNNAVKKFNKKFGLA